MHRELHFCLTIIQMHLGKSKDFKQLVKKAKMDEKNGLFVSIG